jgi:predicted DNA-binding transcriptional regulator AlpA
MTNDLRLRPRAAASYLGISASSLAKRRMRGDPPRYLKLGRSVAYDVTDLNKFLADSRCNSTSEYPAQRLPRCPSGGT